MKITLEGFAGEVQKVQPRYLDQKFAQSVSGARLNRGDLEPMRSPVTIEALGAAADRIYLHGSTWLSWSTDADAVQGPVAQDRLYITRENAAPQMLYSGTFHALALASPGNAPILTALSTPDPALVETVLYALTWVTDLGEESMPSPISEGLEWSSGVIVRIQMDTSYPANRRVTAKRIYRSVTSASGTTDLYFVGERPAAEVFWDHDLDNDPIQEVMPSIDFDAPPDTMRGIVSMPNGMMAAFDGKEVLFCEPFIPHAWPVKYRLKVNDTIVGLAAFGTSLAILTTGTPYIVQGIHPEQMAMDRSEMNFPCVSKRGIVDLGYSVVYPSVDGLVQIGTQGAQLVSAGLWTPEQWRSMQPATFRASHQSGRYAFSFIERGATERALGYVDLSGAQPFFLPVAASYLDLQNHLETGRLCALMMDGVTVVSLDDDGGTIAAYSWLSKPFKIPAPVSFSAVKVDAIAPPSGVTPEFAFHVLRDGVTLHTITDPDAVSRLPSGLSENWQFQIDGNYTVTRAVVAGSVEELLT